MLVVGTILLNIVITLILLTIFLYYYHLAFECDIYPSFPCQTDWKCPGYNADDDNTVVLVNANGDGVTNAMMGCYLNALYGYPVDKNEFNNDCAYFKDKGGNRKPIKIRPKNALADKEENIDGEQVFISAGCNNNGGIVNVSENNFGALCKPGAYQNIYIRPGNTPSDVGDPFSPCSKGEPYCVNTAELWCTDSGAGQTPTYFSGIIGTCES